jgi:signal transduction histidine kinase
MAEVALENAAAYTTELGRLTDPLMLVLAPPMPRKAVLRIMILGFGLMVLLVVAAAYIGYQGSWSIQDNAQDLVREHLVNSSRGKALEASIEKESEELLGQLTWILGACFILALVGSALTVWITNRAFRRLEWQGQELNQVSWHMVDSHEKIARRFSHEMHDELGQALAGLKGMVKRMSVAEMEPMRSEMITLIDEVLGGVRELSQLLRPVILDDFGLDAGLRWLTERFTQRTQIPVDYQSNFNERLAEPLETQLFRIAQEALTNTARHSGATQAWVRLEVNDKTVRLSVEDNGRGIPETASAGRPSLGMVGMRARARQVDGELRVDNRDEGGLRIQVEAPLARPKDGDQQEDSRFAG